MPDPPVTDPDVVFVYVTFADDFDVAALARGALEAGLCACVNVSRIRSLYQWQGSLQDEPEQVGIFKTQRATEPKLRAWLAENHPYDVPCIATLGVQLNEPFADWVRENSPGSQGGGG
jgi:periplasmic divalent cation tolerance protein